MDPRLFNAAFTGDVNVLLGLIQEDPLILHTVTVTTSNTPLHVAALLGHAEFAMVAMQNHPGLADELNQQGFSPIHLASAKGHWEIVRGTLVSRPDLAFIKDEDGKNPLHTAATKGRSQVLREVFSIESAQELTPKGENVFHVAVKHNQFKALETLIQLACENQVLDELVNAKDEDGNTLLHLACAAKNSKIVKLLVSVQTTVEVNAVNSEGSNEPGEIQEVLRSAGAQVSGSRDQAVVINQRQQALAGEDQSLTLRNEKYSGSLRNGIGVLAVLFSTISFQLGINPPGGSWEDWASTTNHNFPNVTHTPAKSIIWELQKRESLTFFKLNAVCFFSSLSILVVLAYTEFLNHSGSCALNKNRQVYWSFLLFELFGALLVSAAIEFVLGMALVTDTNVAYISSNICAGAWFEIVVFSVLAFLVLPFCSFVHGRLSR
ncbi:HOMEOBOX PROTEIN WARIAI [Salix purpurea]|uniref:HOMEOBOX PROTEIN WARIAI n=1 Tax=Salix purpurea TaxID=77065 RepID=A0A9Q0W8L2_SALPP|nr:HOMEOBOX PROTEIN WARIAI [Salix purpurea]